MEILSKSKGKSQGKLEMLYTRYRMDMYRVASRILKDEDLAQDAVQISFEKLIHLQDRIDDINCSKTRSFVIIIVANISKDIYRKRKREDYIPLDNWRESIPDDWVPFDEKMISDEMFYRISKKVKLLTQSEADVISLKCYYQFSDKEIAGLLNISLGNERVRLCRAKKKLKKLLLQDEECWKDEYSKS